MLTNMDRHSMEVTHDALVLQHRKLDSEICYMEKKHNIAPFEITRLKKEKLHIKDQIALIEDQLLPEIVA